MSGGMLNMWSSLVRLTGEGVLTSEEADCRKMEFTSPSEDESATQSHDTTVPSAQGNVS